MMTRKTIINTIMYPTTPVKLVYVFSLKISKQGQPEKFRIYMCTFCFAGKVLTYMSALSLLELNKSEEIN